MCADPPLTWVCAITRITVQYFFIFSRSRAISFLPASSAHFFEALVNAFFLDEHLANQRGRTGRAGGPVTGQPGSPDAAATRLYSHLKGIAKPAGRYQKVSDPPGHLLQRRLRPPLEAMTQGDFKPFVTVRLVFAILLRPTVRPGPGRAASRGRGRGTAAGQSRRSSAADTPRGSLIAGRGERRLGVGSVSTGPLGPRSGVGGGGIEGSTVLCY